MNARKKVQGKQFVPGTGLSWQDPSPQTTSFFTKVFNGYPIQHNPLGPGTAAGFSSGEIQSTVDGIGGIDDIMETVAKIQKVYAMFQQLAPMLKTLNSLVENAEIKSFNLKHRIRKKRKRKFKLKLT